MTKKANRVVEAILEMAEDQLRSGLLQSDLLIPFSRTKRSLCQTGKGMTH